MRALDVNPGGCHDQAAGSLRRVLDVRGRKRAGAAVVRRLRRLPQHGWQYQRWPEPERCYGRKAGSLAGFPYSRAMRTSRGAWDEKSLDTFIAEPQKAIPGNTMPFAGVSDPKQRAEIVDYLKTLQ